MKLLLVTVVMSITFAKQANAKLLDKIVGVFNDTPITLSELQRINFNLPARRSISPQIYLKNKYTFTELLDLAIQQRMIQEKLSSMGYEITDDQVEDHISNTVKGLGVTRKELKQFLTQNGMTYDEYFVLIQSTIEYNLFQSRVIAPLISVSEQQIKNTFYKQNSSNKTFSFLYELVDFTVPNKVLTTKQLLALPKVLKKYQSTGILPESYKMIETSEIGKISEDKLDIKISSVLKKTDEGSFSTPLLLGDYYHIFYIAKKDLRESSLYLTARDQIRNMLYIKSATILTKNWFVAQEDKYFVKRILK